MAGKPTDELLDHNYDGIREFDNPIPAWWNWIFIGSIVFSLVYFVHYHVTDTGPSIVAAYEADMEQFRAVQKERAMALAAELSEEKLAVAMNEAGTVESGRTKFGQVCAACHGLQGEGLIGPNLTDDHWLHADGSLMSIRSVVAKGVVEKGMPPWEKSLSPEEINQVVAFLGTIRNTHVEGKAPEGKEIEASGSPPSEETASSEAADS